MAEEFNWANLPQGLLAVLATGYDEEEVADGLAAVLTEDYGPAPTEEFAREWWDDLRENWLRHDEDALYYVTALIWEGGHFSGEMPTSHNTQVHFLRERNNSRNVREALVDALLVSGTPGAAFFEEDGEDLAETRTRSGNALLSEQPSPARTSGSAPVEPPPHERLETSHVHTLELPELESRLWAAANALRGPVDPADFKTYVFPMLFWKWISDTWDFEHAQAVAEFGDDVDPEVEADYHRFALPQGTHWRDVTVRTDNLGVQIAKALGKIQQANPESLANIFGDAAWGNKERLPEPSLVALIDALGGLRLDPEHVSNDMLGQAYEYLLKNFADASGQKAGEFFTPRSVVHLAVGILGPQVGEAVYDPAAGSGGMLVETINSVRAQGGDTRTLRLYGQEINLTTAAIARMNLFLHDIEDFKIVRGDTLRSPGLRTPDGTLATFNCVIANPPFSLQNWGADVWAADPRSFCGIPPAKNGDFAWIQHMITSMDPDQGRVAVVMPHGVLFRGGAEGRIRKCLIEEDRLEAVIGLPANLFYSTTIPACILVFRATKPTERKEHVLFVDGSQRFTKGRNQNYIDNDDVDALLAAYHEGVDPDDEGGINVRLVPVTEIESNNFDLNIGRYIKTANEDTGDLATALAAYEQARAARIKSEKVLFGRLRVAGIADLGGGDE